MDISSLSVWLRFATIQKHMDHSIHDAASNLGLLCPKCPKRPEMSQNVPKYFKARLGLRAHAHTCARGQFEFWTVQSVIFPSKEPLCA